MLVFLYTVCVFRHNERHFNSLDFIYGSFNYFWL